MKKFIFTLLLFFLPLSVFVIEVFLPFNTFTYRPWEALLFNSEGLFPFYPDKTIKMKSVGDLCHHTKFEIVKDENWITDKLGYRNTNFTESPDILLIGDSFIAGSSLDQDSTLSELLISKLNCKVYNMAPATFSDYIILKNYRLLKKPKIIIYSTVERTIPPKLINDNNIQNISYPTAASFYSHKLKRQYLLKFLNARILKKNGIGIPGIKEKNMFFLNGVNQVYPHKEINEAFLNILAYKEYCDLNGIIFYYLPLPNKETVYFENVPFDVQPSFLNQLNSILKEKNVRSINSISVFNKYRLKNKEYIYHLDDTHWNSRGVNLIADEIKRILTADFSNLKFE
jgi:hypothetical protein